MTRGLHVDVKARLLRAIVGVGGLGILHKLLGLAVALVLARHLGTYAYGQYAFATSLVAMLGIVSAFGVPPLTMREVARHHGSGDKARLAGQVRASWRVTWLAIILALVAGLLVIPFGGWLSAFDLPTYLVALCLIPIAAVLSLICAQLQGLRRVVQSALPGQVVQPLAMVVLVVGLVLVASAKLDATQAMALNVGTTALALAFGWWLLRRYMPRPAPDEARIDPGPQTGVLLSFMMLGGLAIINSRTDVLMLGAMATADEVGLYRVAFQGAQLVGFPLLIVGSAFAPEVAALGRPAKREALARLLGFSSVLTALGATIAFLVAVFAGRWGIALVLGEVYLPAWLPLVILAAAQLLTGLFGPVAMLLNMQGLEKRTVGAGVFAAASNVALNAVLIPQYGMVGAAVATGASLLVWNISLGLLLLRVTGLLPGPLALLSRYKSEDAAR